MEQIKVSELASEFDIRDSTVISELKKIGVWVPSADTQVDQDIAKRVRRRLEMLAEIEQEKKKKTKAKKTPAAKPRKSIKQLGKGPRKGVRKPVEETPEESAESPLGGSLKPRKGTSPAYRRVEKPVTKDEEIEEEALEAEEDKQPEGPLPVSPEQAEKLMTPEAAAKKAEAEEEEKAKKEAGKEDVEAEEADEAEEKAKAEEEAEEKKAAAEKKAEEEAKKAEEKEAAEEEKKAEEEAAAEAKEAEEAKKAEEAEEAEAKEEAKKAEEKEAAEEEKKAAAEKKAAEEAEKKKALEEAKRKEAEKKKREAVKRKRAKVKLTELPKPISERDVGEIKRPQRRQARILERPPVQPKPQQRTRVKKPPLEREHQDLTLSENLSVRDFSEKISVKSKDVLRELMGMGVMATINQTIDQGIMEKLCEKFNVTPTFVTFEEAVIEETKVEDKPENLKERPPVVTVMGHVDHGKTSLLDAIRETRVAAGEAGGITQHIGAYHVDVAGKRIVFLDTPGHEAFTLMRSRGAQATDLVVLVVAADDGVMPQTREAIDHARAADVPILVAINKIDKPDAQPDRVKQQLSDLELVAEDWGGDTVMVEVSAVKQTNLDELLEMISLVSEVLELKANPDRSAAGVILEAKIDKGRGSVATVLVQNGTLSIGDSFIAGKISGRVRAMFDDRGESVEKSGPGSAVEILGLQGLPEAGDAFQGVSDASKARQVAEHRREKHREHELSRGQRLSLDDLYSKMEAGEVRELPIVLKADAQGSVEVLADMLTKIKSEKVKVKIIHSGVGAISESDVLLASASDAIVIGFNVRPERSAADAAEKEGVDIRLHTVIYDITAEIEKALVGLLDPTVKEVALGRAEVRETFSVPRYGVVAGSMVTEGEIRRNASVRLLRDNVVVHEGRIDSLRRFKEDVNKVRKGYECGISLEGYQDVKVNDIIECFTHEETTPELH
ncbi:MAG TPA: translation initiation factor IF-2 [Acidobacteriota bacterium]|nr:translation initiation factor IF-2 [Acidobacteriota bacterium]